ncbi:MAG TPA: adenylate/guanylate cyclase domain-containing protein [Gemmatimonadaceae bacterium]|nr:adenylate/guanylate cyclase domain-containing protein [Gemmatimonadaceae bacterium]
MTDVKLQWQDAQGELRELEVLDKAFVGRTCAGVDPSRAIVLNDPNVSRDHLVIVRTAHGTTVRDMSRNGTWVNGVRMTQGAERPLENGDVIRLGQVELTVTIDSPQDAELAEDDADQTMTSWTTVSPVYQHVTNLVADLRGFTSLSETIGSEQMYAVMNSVFKTFSDLVVAHRGTIKDYAGDAIYAFWEHGLLPNPEKARLACTAALAQLDALPQIAAQLAVSIPEASQLRVGWGVTTGMVTVSQYGSRAADLAVLGDSTNLAFRISGLANKDLPAPIVLDEQTKALIDGGYQLASLGQHAIKGKREPVPLYGIKP